MKELLKVNLGRFLGESSSVYIPQEINVEPQGNNKGTKCDTLSLEKKQPGMHTSHMLIKEHKDSSDTALD